MNITEALNQDESTIWQHGGFGCLIFLPIFHK